MDEDVKDLSHMSEREYKAAMRKIEHDSVQPCVNCTSKCYLTGLRTECKPYREWFYRYHGLRHG